MSSVVYNDFDFLMQVIFTLKTQFQNNFIFFEGVKNIDDSHISVCKKNIKHDIVQPAIFEL